MKTNTTYFGRARQPGFTLVELMVAMTLGLLIMLFVGSLYLNSNRTYGLNDANSRLEQDTRFAMALLGRNLTQAGYGNQISLSNGRAQTDFSGQGFHGCDNGFVNPLAVGAGVCAAGAGSPAFELSYPVDAYNANTGQGADCNGQNPVDGAGNDVPFAINRFYLATPAGAAFPNLYCVGNGNVAGRQPLINNVEVMLLTYGVDTNDDQAPDRFLTSAATLNALPAANTAINPGADIWKDVVSVAVCLQVVSPENVTPNAQTYTDCNGAQKTAADGKLRTVVRNVFTLRNNAGA